MSLSQNAAHLKALQSAIAHEKEGDKAYVLVWLCSDKRLFNRAVLPWARDALFDALALG